MGRRILLTGATRGLGRALVDRFVEGGHVVLGCGSSADGVAALRAAYGAPQDFDVVDVSDAGAVDRWARRLLAEGGPPDLILNNAAIINRSVPLWELEPDEVDRLFAVNLSGTVNVIRAFLPALIGAGRGVVANFSSGWGRSTAPMVATYCASKYGIEGLSAALAQEVPPGITVCAVNPGIIDTAMLRSCFGDEASSFEEPDAWSHGAAKYLLGLDASANGRALSVP